MKCLVTGGAGFIGSSIVDALLAQSAEVIAVDAFVDYYPREFKERNLEKARTNKNFSFVEGDLNELDLKSLIKGVDVIFHQAAQAGVRASWGEQFQDYTAFNVLASQKILEAARSSNTIKQIVYASSSSVYGDAERFPTVETDLPKPRSPYGVTKLAAEHLMVLYSKQFHVPTVSLRYFTVYGPRQRPDMAFHRFIRAGLTGQPITLYGDGEQIRDFTYIDDIVAANLAAAKFQQKGCVFNLGGGTDVSVNDVLKILAKELGELNIVRHPAQPGDVFRTGADTSLAQKNLNFAPAFDLITGLQNEINWLKTVI